MENHKNQILEDRSISNNNMQFPNQGWAFFVVGGPGSGKNYFAQNVLPIYGKTFDFDDVVEKIAKLRAKKLQKKEPTQKMKKDIRKNDAGRVINYLEDLFLKHNKQRDNVIFYCCGEGPKKNEDSTLQILLNKAKTSGYKICFIYIAANRSVALKRNISRDRTVPDGGFHSRYNSANSFLPSFLNSSQSNIVDMAYIVLSSGDNLNDEYGDRSNNVIKLKKTNNGFIFPTQNPQKPQNKYVNSYDDLTNFLGPKEKNPGFFKPETYLSISDIKKGANGKTIDGKQTYLKESQLRNIIKEIILEYLRK